MRIPRWLALVVLASCLGIAAPAQAAAPTNDTFAHPTPITSLPALITQTTVGATNDANVSVGSCGLQKGVWFKITPTQTGTIVVHTRGSGFDTALLHTNVYSGTLYPDTCQDDTYLKRTAISFYGYAGQPTYVLAGGFMGATGQLKLSVSRGGTASGVLHDSSTNAPVTYGCVFLRNASGGSIFGSVSVTGFYAVEGLMAGDYQPEGSDCQGGRIRPSAYPITVYEGRTSRSDLVVDRGFIQGVVTSAANGQPVAACVSASNANTFGNNTNTSPTGYYRFAVAPGTWNVRFSDCGNGAFAPQYFSGANDVGAATPVVVNAGSNVPNVDAHMQRGAVVVGAVTDEVSHNGTQACVAVYRASDNELLNSVYNGSSSTGFYRIPGLPVTNVVVRAEDCGSRLHAPEWFNNSGTHAGAQVLPLAAGGTVTANVALGAGKRITGVVRRNSDGRVAPGVCISVEQTDAEPQPTYGFAYTSATGYYSVPGLNAGHYKEKFEDCGAHVAPQWYNGKLTRASADAITIGASSVTANARLLREGTAHGQLFNPATGKRAEACISLERGTEQQGVSDQATITGAVAVGSLATGHYAMRALQCGEPLAGGTQNLGAIDVVAGQDTKFGRLNITPADTDGDGLSDRVDNCPMSPNADQADANNNDLGDVCDVGPDPGILVNIVSVPEGNATHTFGLHVRLAAACVEPIAVRITTPAGSAQPGSDYTALNKTITFKTGQTDIVVPVTILGDHTPEPDEYFTFRAACTRANSSFVQNVVTAVSFTLTNDD